MAKRKYSRIYSPMWLRRKINLARSDLGYKHCPQMINDGIDALYVLYGKTTINKAVVNKKKR